MKCSLVIRVFIAGAFLLYPLAFASAQMQLPVYSLGAQSGGSSSTQTSQDTSSCDPSEPGCNASSSQGMVGMGTMNQTPTRHGANLNPDVVQGVQRQNPQQQRSQQQEVSLPLDAPTEFQQMVANSIGKMLPIYGAQLFRTIPSTFAPLNQAPVPSDYVIGPNDELIIQGWGQVTLNGHFIVDRSGNIYIPQVGSVHVAGLHYDEVQPFLKMQISKNFRNFEMSVSMGQLRSIQIFITGQARRPGTWTLSSLSTLVTAIFSTGGVSPQGSLRGIELRRSGKLITVFDAYDLILRGDKSRDVALLPADVIYIPPVGPQVAIAGSVKHPAIYELKPGTVTTVGEGIDLAAGATNIAVIDKLRLERVDTHQLRSIKELSLNTEDKSVALQDGDLLELTSLPGQFKDAVTLRGNVANPGRYTWKSGMHVLDLIPNKEALITRDYWLKRNRIGQSMMSYIPSCLPATPYGVPSLRYGIPVGEEGDNPLWKYSSIHNSGLSGLIGRSVTDETIDQNGATMDSMRTTNGGLDCDASDNQTYQSVMSTDNTTQSLNGQQNISGQANSNHTGTTNTVAGATTINSVSSGPFLPKNDVKLSEPDINWSYAVIERQNKENLTTALFPFNLGKAVLEGDASQNLELQPGDVVTIFSKADMQVPQQQQTRFVRLEGEFASSGVYSVKPGETLRQLVKRAGGLTAEAYLYGAEFTRESTRRVQQQRLKEYVDQIALMASTNAQNTASRAISTTDAATFAAQTSQTQNIISSLRNVRASGRIVLELPADASSIDQLPDMPLEDGDKLVIPRVPSTVAVNGAVYNQNAFLYDPQRRLGDYMRLAGGANRDADKNRAFVLRAGGDVISKQYSSSLRGHGFESVRLYPGDTVVIPLNLDKGKNMRMIVDIAQIVGQFGIAVAAMNTVLGR